MGFFHSKDNLKARLVPRELQLFPREQDACILQVLQELVQLTIKGTM